MFCPKFSVNRVPSVDRDVMRGAHGILGRECICVRMLCDIMYIILQDPTVLNSFQWNNWQFSPQITGLLKSTDYI